MLPPWIVMGLAATAFADISGRASDSVTLTDGTELRGQVVAGASAGGLTVVLRRDDARRAAPAWIARWERDEAPLILAGRRERRERLIDWRRDRAGTSPVVAAWLDREINRLSAYRPPRTPLTAARIPRARVAAVAVQPAETGRLLRLGWLAGIADVETLPVDELTDALQALGPIRPDDPAFVDALLPIYPEPDDLWRARRASTEVTAEPGLRFVRFRQFTLPENGPVVVAPAVGPPRDTSELLDSPAGRIALESVEGVSPFDPTRDLLDSVARRGRWGAVVSTLEFAVDSDRAEAVSTFWVLGPGGQWAPRLSRKAEVTTDVPVVAAVPAPEPSPIRSALLVLESVASSPSGPETSLRRQRHGLSAEVALGRARGALDRDLAPLVLPAH